MPKKKQEQPPENQVPGESASQNADMLPLAWQAKTMKKLKACVYCRLILTVAQWNEIESCPNCKEWKGMCDTTDNFNSVIQVTYPQHSGVAKAVGLGHQVPGMYALEFVESDL